jgi:HSP20 family molecular chaperone IbpA
MRQDRGSPAEATGRRSAGGLFTDMLGFDPFRNFFPALANAPNALGLEISRTENGYTVEIPVPGFRPEQIEVTVQDDTLMVSGKSDRRSFTRTLVLPDEIDPEGIAANVDHGLLSLHLRRRPEREPRRITVQSGAPAGTVQTVRGSTESSTTEGQRTTASTP